jgi:hypothetical protein
LIPSEPSITVHSRSSKLRSPCTTKGSASANLTRRLSARCPHDGQPIAAHLAVGLGQRTGRKQHALLLQTDHVFEVAWQMLGDRFGRRPALGEDDVELFTKHGLGELADALLRHRVPPLRPGGLSRAVIALHDREHGETAGGDQGSRARPDPFDAPVFL